MDLTRRWPFAAWLFAGAAFGLRAAYGFAHHHPLSGGGDTLAYLAAARNIVFSGGHVAFDRPPLFPIFLALTYVLPGEHLALFILAQSLVSSAVVFLIGRALWEWNRPLASLWAMAFV